MIIERDESFKTFSYDEYQIHVKKVQKEMVELGIDVLLVSNPENIHYTTGYRSWYLSSLFRPVFALVPQSGNPAIVLRILEKGVVKLTSWVDEIYVTGSKERDLGHLDAEDHTEAVIKAINKISPNCKTIGLEQGEGAQFFWSLDILNDLKDRADMFDYVDGNLAIQKARMLKTDWEINQIKTACLVTEKAVLDTFAEVIPGKTTEKDVSRGIASRMTLGGIDKISYLTVTSGIQKYSTINAYSTDRIVQYGEVLLVDISGHYNGYASDITRMMYLDKDLPEDIEEMARVSSESVIAGKNIMKPGVELSNVNEVVEAVIIDAGYEDYLIHSSGHSIGLNVVEYPMMSAGSNETLQEGMIFAVENGVYPFEKEHGAENLHLAFRMEDIVLVTAEGSEWLTGPAKPIYTLKDFSVLGIEK